MGQAIGDVLPLVLGAAISPVPIVLMLRALMAAGDSDHGAVGVLTA